MDVDISKVGKVTCPSRRTFKCGGSHSWGPSLDHHEVAPMVAWVLNLSVGLGSIPNLTYSRQVLASEGLRKGT
jgi:hypothetical protein